MTSTTVLRRRRGATPQQRRATRAARAALAGQQKAIAARPQAPPPTADLTALADSLRRLAAGLRRDAGGDRARRAAATGVAELASAYDLIARATRADDADVAAALTTKSVAAIDAAERHRAQAGAAWPL